MELDTELRRRVGCRLTLRASNTKPSLPSTRLAISSTNRPEFAPCSHRTRGTSRGTCGSSDGWRKERTPRRRRHRFGAGTTLPRLVCPGHVLLRKRRVRPLEVAFRGRVAGVGIAANTPWSTFGVRSRRLGRWPRSPVQTASRSPPLPARVSSPTTCASLPFGHGVDSVVPSDTPAVLTRGFPYCSPRPLESRRARYGRTALAESVHVRGHEDTCSLGGRFGPAHYTNVGRRTESRITSEGPGYRRRERGRITGLGGLRGRPRTGSTPTPT